jgi:hypothetical protein
MSELQVQQLDPIVTPKGKVTLEHTDDSRVAVYFEMADPDDEQSFYEGTMYVTLPTEGSILTIQDLHRSIGDFLATSVSQVASSQQLYLGELLRGLGCEVDNTEIAELIASQIEL